MAKKKRKAEQNDPQWLDEFQKMADEQLGDGSACQQIHPIVERWFEDLLEGEPPRSRPSVEQAMACLTTEVITTLPEEVQEAIAEVVDEEEFYAWVEQVLLIGRAFEMSLRSGQLDDL
ncbi:MAG: hypothetical protein HXY40_16025 [Chloroflexi bacterium]|nr:hypothetical protein [Chloroflexota bacterium]